MNLSLDFARDGEPVEPSDGRTVEGSNHLCTLSYVICIGLPSNFKAASLIGSAKVG
jgi:hypothetical protein